MCRRAASIGLWTIYLPMQCSWSDPVDSLLPSVPSHTGISRQFWVLPVLAVSTNIILTRICVLSSSIDSHKEKKNVYMIPQAAPGPAVARLPWAPSGPSPWSKPLLQAHTHCFFWLLGLHARHRLSFGLASTVLGKCQSRVLPRCEFERLVVGVVCVVGCIMVS